MQDFPAHSQRQVPKANGGGRRIDCANCGKQVAPGARYCVHCGTEQSVPTPIAAVAAALMSGEGTREAANAAHADPAQRSDDNTRLAGADGIASSAPFAAGDAANGADDNPAARPAYADAPGRRGLAIGFISCCIVAAIAAAGLFASRLEDARTRTAASEPPVAGERAPAAEPPASSPAVAAPPASLETPSRTGVTAGGEEAAPSVNAAAPSAPDAAAAPVAPGAAAPPERAPVEIKPLPAHPPAARAPRRAPAAAAPSVAGNGPSPAMRSEPASRPAPPAAAPPATTKGGATEPAQQRLADRWKRLDDDLSRCTREDFIARVICGQRVRFRYCDGYWGKVPQCPGNPTPERGQ